MSGRPLASILRTSLGLLLGVSALAPASALAAGKKTHLGVPVNQVVNLRTQDIPNDNAGGALFRYDREGAPFVVPEGFSFVVTDILIHPADLPNTTSVYLVFLNLGGHVFQASLVGAETRHYELAAGMVIKGGSVPEARNTTFSSNHCEVQLLGYFVKGTGLAGGEALFPAPAP